MNILLRSLLIIILLTNYSISSDIELKNPKTIGNTTIQTNRFGGSSTIISEDEIKTSGAQSVGDLLKLVPGSVMDFHHASLLNSCEYRL